jgi:hypothetical protein
MTENWIDRYLTYADQNCPADLKEERARLYEAVNTAVMKVVVTLESMTESDFRKYTNPRIANTGYLTSNLPDLHLVLPDILPNLLSSVGCKKFEEQFNKKLKEIMKSVFKMDVVAVNLTRLNFDGTYCTDSWNTWIHLSPDRTAIKQFVEADPSEHREPCRGSPDA